MKTLHASEEPVRPSPDGPPAEEDAPVSESPAPPPARYADAVTVSATGVPERLGAAGTAVTLLDERTLAATRAVVLDDALRQVPGLSLTRRGTSATLNPTTQGLSLRGLGGSGASRALVLDDDAPLNDPFGGAIAWGRVPLAAIDGAEVLRGGASHLYGSGALSGVVDLRRRPVPEARAALADVSLGSRGEALGSAFGGGRAGGWGAAAAFEAFAAGGYVSVAPESRGAVDTPVDSARAAGELTVERWIGDVRVFARGGLFSESRDNGTPLQVNSTRTRSLLGGVDARLFGGDLSFRARVLDQDYRQTFSVVAPDRSAETLDRVQAVPSSSAGASLRWSSARLGPHTLVAGLDASSTDGSSGETTAASSPVVTRAGGRVRLAGAFLEDVARLGPTLTVLVGVRGDLWRNEAGRAERRLADGTFTARDFPARSESALSPRATVSWEPTGLVSVSASIYRAFRAPTLNELYRGFRVGNVETQANPELAAERVTGGEAGVRFEIPSARVRARAAVFLLRLEDPVTNVTLSSTPALVTRQRRNSGRSESRGAEVEAALTSGRVSASAAWLFADSVVTDSPADRSLEGLRVPQVPRHQLTGRVSWTGPLDLTLDVAGRAWTSSFEDDRNRLPLAGGSSFDVGVTRPVARGLSASVGVANVFDQREEIGRTPVVALAAPRTIRARLRVFLP